MNMNRYATLLIFLIGLVIHLVGAIQMDLNPGDMRCIGQELDQLEKVIFATSASSKVKEVKQKLSLIVTDPNDEIVLNDKISIGSRLKEVEHKIESRGLYKMCFELYDGKTPVRVFFHVDYKPRTLDGVDKSRKVLKDDLPSLQNELQIVGDKLKEISTAIEHARSQEIYLKETGELMVSRIQWFSNLSIVILLSTSVWQLIYLRRFFASKKLL